MAKGSDLKINMGSDWYNEITSKVNKTLKIENREGRFLFSYKDKPKLYLNIQELIAKACYLRYKASRGLSDIPQLWGLINTPIILYNVYLLLRGAYIDYYLQFPSISGVILWSRGDPYFITRQLYSIL
jgi:hypothetical protein